MIFVSKIDDEIAGEKCDKGESCEAVNVGLVGIELCKFVRDAVVACIVFNGDGLSCFIRRYFANGDLMGLFFGKVFM